MIRVKASFKSEQVIFNTNGSAIGCYVIVKSCILLQICCYIPPSNIITIVVPVDHIWKFDLERSKKNT